MGKHYIPQFLLKNWSVTDLKPGPMIHSYNIDRDTWRHHEPIVRQAQERNMYGQLETTLSHIESWAAPPIRRIVDSGRLPDNQPGTGKLTDRAKVALFLAATYCRNLSEADFQNEIYSVMLQQETRTHYHEELLREGIDINDYDITVAPPGSLAMRNIGVVAKCLDGMGIYLLFSEDGGFVIGDSPCTVYNKWYTKSPERQHLAPGVTGTCLFVPLSPRHVILLYDCRMYDSAKSSAIEHDWIIRVDQSAVAEVNLLQLVYARHCIYSNEPKLRRSVRRLRPKVVGLRSELQKTGAGIELLDVKTGNRVERYLTFGRSAPPLNLALTYLAVASVYRHVPHGRRHVDLPRTAYKRSDPGEEDAT